MAFCRQVHHDIRAELAELVPQQRHR
jgi:hypothetical protein